MPDALVLAGGRPDPALPQGLPNKAFVPLCGRTMVEFVLEALRAASSVRRVAMVGPDPLPPTVRPYLSLAIGDRGSMLDNVAAGLAALSSSDRVLAAAADIPLLTPEAVDAFITAARSLDADIVYSVVRREDVVREAPEIRKTSVRLREGTFTGGSLILLEPRAFGRVRTVLDRAVRARKRPWELAGLFGLRAVVGLLTGTLTIPDLERRAALLTGIRAKALICRAPEVAIDVDTPEMLAAVSARLTQRLRPAAPRPPERTVRP